MLLVIYKCIIYNIDTFYFQNSNSFMLLESYYWSYIVYKINGFIISTFKRDNYVYAVNEYMVIVCSIHWRVDRVECIL